MNAKGEIGMFPSALEELEILVSVSGEIRHASEARVSAMDHGFLYGDSVYETLRSFNRKPFLLAHHIERLERSLARIFLEPPCSFAEIESAVLRMMDEHGERYGTEREVAMRLVVTRGPGPIGLDLSLCREPQLLVFGFPVPNFPPALYTEGIRVVVSTVRRNHPSALDPGIKSGNFLNNILAFRDAKSANAQEAILLGANGFVAEGTTSNIFAVIDARVTTPLTFGILDGITRRVVLDEASNTGIEVDERDLAVEELLAADEVFITSSVRGVVPVTSIDGKIISGSRVGPVTARLQSLYDARVERECPPRC